ncbi:DUF2391 family protein [Thermococcus sp.]|uniref:DUF2391 family protein n=1 Tax=Thermococcus sp. TaxID=35749 RepID=UPI002637F133|nr:DUF2391 family protein [Thermococcus sp.]
MMSESNAEEMMNPEPEHEVVELEKLRKSVEKLTRQVEKLEEQKKPDSLGWDDIAQEIVGAITFALPFLFTGEVWDVAKDISVERSLAIFLMTLILAYLFLTKANLGNLKREEVFHIPKRLITVALISYAVSAFLIYIFGIDYIAHFNRLQYFNATVIISTFAVIGAIAVDMVR